ncbi:hypothetical protein EDC04DRAFT_2601485 [Pisolithus marmoratus]|nr:hypothetical protein EDC04DRAFT_2601485 [Pisolithus marmoratus]
MPPVEGGAKEVDRNCWFGSQESVFKISDSACLELLPISVDEGSAVPLFLPDDGLQQLVWIQESTIDNSLQTPEYEAEVANFVDWLVPEERITYPDAQAILFEGRKLSPGTAHILSTRLPWFWKALPIPASPVSYLPVPETAIEQVRDILVSLCFDALVAGIVNGISVDHMQKDIRYLTNEDGTSGIASRHSFHHGSKIAAKWLKTQFEDAGAACRFMPFLEGFAPNIICRYDAKTESFDTVLISGHCDSRGFFGLEQALGGNDDGSGTVSILNIARRIKQTGITFRTNIKLVVFAGEEQGLLGSKAYAKELRESDANVVLMIQADMLAYHVPDEPPQLGLAQFLELTVGFTVVCCSDHQSSCMDTNIRVSLVESPSMNRVTLQLTSSNVRVQVRLIHINPLSGLIVVLSVADPMYHNSGDLSDRLGYDLNQVRSICKVQTFLTRALDEGTCTCFHRVLPSKLYYCLGIEPAPNVYTLATLTSLPLPPRSRNYCATTYPVNSLESRYPCTYHARDNSNTLLRMMVVGTNSYLRRRW